MQRQHLLRDQGDYVSVLIIQLEIQTENIAAQLPCQAFDIHDVLDDMEPFGRHFKGQTAFHFDKVSLMQRKELSVYIRNQMAMRIRDICSVMQ